MNKYIDMKYIEVKQPIGSFYIGKLSWSDLLEVAHADIRRIEKETKKQDSFDSLLGLQRELSKTRLSEIAEYVQTQDATFPTSVILAINSKSYYLNGNEISGLEALDYEDQNTITEVNNVLIDEKSDIIRIRKDKNIASILDGQHRIEGLREGYKNNLPFNDFEFNITLFIDIDIDDQAQVFSVINKAQTKVNKSLVYDLYDFARSKSPQKTSHDIVRILNRKEGSPFFKKIKILGVASDKERETIAQATLVELILDYISSDPMKDRDLIRRKRNLKLNKVGLKTDEKDKVRRIFRTYFINEEEEKIINILWEYFDAVKKRWPKAWDRQVAGSILPKSTGIIALMKFLKSIYIHLGSEWNKTSEDYLRLLKKSQLKDNDFTKENFVPGTSGQSQLLKMLIEECIK